MRKEKKPDTASKPNFQHSLLMFGKYTNTLFFLSLFFFIGHCMDTKTFRLQMLALTLNQMLLQTAALKMLY